ncbi:inositol-1,4,5-trisphosphate 5-phosphatase' [Musa troglodytarum]|uniref:Inositol-1,4,5-trisphosphate 5-phosphatase n=1 Tax=Musa troglodytarum TaxID=320322 RepID=A0A9E7HWJ8_9LILI|nr:inositol-1,4,5-trisphosphate 5-phosphatase' [Musa troglodytarum]
MGSATFSPLCSLVDARHARKKIPTFLLLSLQVCIFLVGAMRAEQARMPKSSSWTKTLVRKWLHSKNAESSSDRDSKFGEQQRRKSCSDKDSSVLGTSDLSGGWVAERSGNLEPPPSQNKSPAGSSLPTETLRALIVLYNCCAYAAADDDDDGRRVFVGTWNVGGRPPHGGLNLRDWLMSTPSSPADIYVLGFQEIVPLNAGNVLGPRDKGPAGRWLSLIGQTLDSHHRAAPGVPGRCTNAAEKPRSDLSPTELGPEEAENGGEDYRLVASKQMVGIFLCVWVRTRLVQCITSLEVSCVGTGIMGCMGNKGSASVSMTLHRTTFCFVCTHLASGEREEDEGRRNSDVMEIMKRTRFPQARRRIPGAAQTISEHDKIIWLGDLNYRLASTGNDTNELLKKQDWQSLVEKDQLRVQQKAGGVFAGWEEGRIRFPPTYKYISNSDIYDMNSANSRDKRRTPAWCDRILWRGKGMKQMWYVRGESRFSDHRPVCSLFAVQLDDVHHVVAADQRRTAGTDSRGGGGSPCSSWGKVQAEEMFLVGRTHSCSEASRF